MPPMEPPLVLHLTECRVRYDGRAKARQEGGALVVLVKADGSVVAHAVDGGVRAQFYNPTGRASAWRRLDRVHVRGVSRKGETLHISGVPILIHHPEGAGDAPDRPPRVRVSGLEDDLVERIAREPGLVGLAGPVAAREERRVGGRVDLRFGDTVVEVKRAATVAAFDQALRYLRDPEVARVKIACLRASRGLEELVAREARVELRTLDGAAIG